MSFPARFTTACLLLLVAAYPARPRSQAVASVTAPQQQFGARIGDDYFLATHAQLEEYWTKIDAESDRVRLMPIGSTAEGRTQWMAVVSSPENLARLDRYRDIARRLALAEGLTDDDARALAAEGKAIVCIAGGLHADEVLGAQQLIELVYRLASGDDSETARVLRDVIVLAVHANPDGHALVADWYMRETAPAQRTLDGIPRLYQKYAGHDLNRDFYLVSQPETENLSRVLYREWYPHVVYDHHQPGPEGTVMFAPPFNGPINHVLDPLVPAGVDLFGAAMHARFAAERKAGVTMRSGSTYTMWWNGGLRTTAYFHNQIGLLTETIGSPTPGEIPFVASRQVRSPDLPSPIAPGRWHFRQSIEYSLTANYAVLDAASRYRETLLLNVYRMARNAIAAGTTDAWIASPNASATRDPRQRAPRAYVLPASQPDFPTAAKFVGALVKSGVVVHRATAPFPAGATTYPAGSFVVQTAQAYRPHVLDMFEPQDHPDDRPAPGAAPMPPYDIAGWTLAFQMGVKFDRILDAVSGPFERVADVRPPRGRVDGGAASAGYLLSHHQNDAFVIVNRILAAGGDVWWPGDRTIGDGTGTGAIYVAAAPAAAAIVERGAADLGVSARAVTAPPRGPALRVRPVRVGLWDRYGGASTSGWIRWILDTFEFPYELVYPHTLDAGGLEATFDVLILPDEAVPPATRRDDGVPPEYQAMRGRLSGERTLPRLQEFVEGGGTLVAIGDAAAFVAAIGGPIAAAAVETTPDGARRALPASRFFIPGSVLRVRVDNTTPLAYGFEPQVDVMFERSPAFSLAEARQARRVAWFEDAPLRSGWARGQEYLRGAAAAVDIPVGGGRLVLFGPEIAFRGQAHATFKFLFNAIHLGRAAPVDRIE